MRLTKFTHACVRLEIDRAVVVIDPGIWSERSALDGADAVLLTHEHSDHADLALLGGFDGPIYAPRGADLGAVPFVAVDAGAPVDVAGIEVLPVGGRHAHVHRGAPDTVNLGYVVAGGGLYHPGDALHVPSLPIGTLLVPLQGSWLKTTEALDFVDAVGPARSIGIHDAQVNERGLGSLNSWLTRATASPYRYLAPGESV